MLPRDHFIKFGAMPDYLDNTKIGDTVTHPIYGWEYKKISPTEFARQPSEY